MASRIVTAVLASGLLAGTAGELLAQAKFPRWHDSLETAAERSRESGKPLFVVFRCVR